MGTFSLRKKSLVFLHSSINLFKIISIPDFALTIRSSAESASQVVIAVKKVKLSLCLANYALLHEGVWGSGCTSSHLLHLGTSWRQAVSFTPLPLYLRGKIPRHPLDRRLGGPQSRSGLRAEEKVHDPTGTRTPSSSPAHILL
jgi:hypothetical protein